MTAYTDPQIPKSALIIIDTQNDFTLDNAPAQIAGTIEVVPKIRRLLESYRKKGLPIVHVVRLYLRDGSNVDLCRRKVIEDGTEIAIPNSYGAEIVEELKPQSATKLNSDILLSGEAQEIGANEFVLYKPRWGAFYGTALDAFLKEREIDTLVFSGCNFPNCPRTSIYEASERDYKIVLAEDAISGLYEKGKQELENIGVLVESADKIVGMVNA